MPENPTQNFLSGISGEKKEIQLSLSKTTILDSSKLKEFAGDNFKFDEYGKIFSKRVENIVGKG